MTELTIFHYFGPILKLALFIATAIIVVAWVKKCDIPIVKDEDMEMSVFLIFPWKSYAILSIAPAITLIILFALILMLTKRGPFPGTGYFIDRKPIKKSHGSN